MVELVIADVDVVAAVIPQGEAEALARATQPSRHQIVVTAALQAVSQLFNKAQLGERLEADAQLFFFSFEAQTKGFFKAGQGQGFAGGKLVEQVGDRELHGVGRVGGGPGCWSSHGVDRIGGVSCSRGSKRCPRAALPA